MMKRFHLDRLRDEAAVPRLGVIAEGVQFSDGTVAARWPERDGPPRAPRVSPSSTRTWHPYGRSTPTTTPAPPSPSCAGSTTPCSTSTRRKGTRSE